MAWENKKPTFDVQSFGPVLAEINQFTIVDLSGDVNLKIQMFENLEWSSLELVQSGI